MLAVGCPRGRGAVALHEERPCITTAGTVELWRRGRWDRRDVPVAAMVALDPAPFVACARVAKPLKHRHALKPAS